MPQDQIGALRGLAWFGGGDAAVIRLEGSLKAVAISADGNGRYGFLDPYVGAALAVSFCVSARTTVSQTSMLYAHCIR